MTHVCATCRADWTAGRFSATCDECGGGAMQRACPVCEGRCGEVWRRAVLDSHDSGRAHWAGRCGLRTPRAGSAPEPTA